MGKPRIGDLGQDRQGKGGGSSRGEDPRRHGQGTQDWEEVPDKSWPGSRPHRGGSPDVGCSLDRVGSEFLESGYGATHGVRLGLPRIESQIEDQGLGWQV